MACYSLAGPSVELLNNFNLGVGISGLTINCFRIIILATIDSNTTGAQIFFYTTGVYLMLCSYLAWKFVCDFEAHNRLHSFMSVSGAPDSDFNDHTAEKIAREPSRFS